MPTYKTKEVFVAGGMPSHTYVQRDELQLESQLISALDEKYQIICITGPTKSGKSVLCQKVLDGRESVWIHGGQIDSADEFWKTAAEELGIASEVTTTNASRTTVGVRYFLTASYEGSETDQIKYFASAKQGVLNVAKQNNVCLVVDDFHYMPPDVQKTVVRAVKSEVFKGLDVVLIAVPHRAFDAIAAEPEMQGRFVHIKIPVWSGPQLASIPHQGFPLLHIEASRGDINQFVQEAHGSPILMQRFCHSACKALGIEETVNPWVDFNISDQQKSGIFRDVAKNFGFPTYKVLADGPQTRTDRNPRRLRAATGTVDIYEAVLLAVASTGPKDATKYDEIREALRNVLVDADLPQKQQVTNTLNYMAREASDKLKGEPPIEWKDDVLYITDPMLQFYLRWSVSNSLT